MEVTAMPATFETVLYSAAWGRDRITPRALNLGELADIRTLNATIAILEVARIAIRTQPPLNNGVEWMPVDVADELDELITLLGNSRKDIEQIPQLEADEANERAAQEMETA